MKIIYIANIRLPTEKAHGIQIMNMCAALAATGAEVELVVPGRPTTIAEDPFIFYGLPRTFDITTLRSAVLPLWMPGAFTLHTLVLALRVRLRFTYKPLPDIVYTRGEVALFFMRILPKNIKLVWETHIKPGHPERYRAAASRAALIVSVTKHYAEEIPSLWNVEVRKVLYAPDGVALSSLEYMESKEEARTLLQLPLDRQIVLYAGSDLPWKGLHLLRDAALALPKECLTVFVGPIKGDSTDRVLFVGTKPPTEVRRWLAAADVLVLTGDPHSQIAREYTSPLKLFEYMAAGRPIVATDLPAIRDVLSHEIAYLAEPTQQGLTHALKSALQYPEKAEAKAIRAKMVAREYSWEARAVSILKATVLN
jgi:glycosyltransferase involved in cell wall biosynthesis